MAVNPKASSGNIIEFGSARFTFLTDRFVRMEWARDGVFEDRATLAVVNRRMPAVTVRASESGKTLTLKTKALTLTFTNDGKVFSKKNLRVQCKAGRKSEAWVPGKKSSGNLKGTYRTLDACRGDRHIPWGGNPNAKGNPIELCDGFLSTDGWALIDDTGNVVLDPSLADKPWVTSRPSGTRRDWYLLAYGTDYKSALADAAKVFGRQPLPPRYTLGYWWSRYWEYTDKEIEDLVARFDRLGLPLDVMVIDMDWHTEGWTGYTWDKRFFPDPAEFLKWLKQQDLKITLNLHPADGVSPKEEQFERMARAMGLDPKKAKRVPFDITDPRFMNAYFKILHHPDEKRGVDFWWMDWQQGESSKLPGLDPLPWLNQLHWEDMEERDPGKRPLIFSRFGGHGAGRYPIGFSGDTAICWESLAYQPYFTATANNVLYGYWSHDIGGHFRGTLGGELYLRWVQFGCHSPILRTHTSKDAKNERRVWEFPSPYSDLMMDAIRHRYELVPYIYTENRACYDTGLSLCRPMYIEWPNEKDAYKATGQYCFGSRMIVAPAVTPVGEDNEMSEVKVWLPKGKWFDLARGVTETGGGWIKRRYMLSETPVFVPAGAVYPGQRAPQRLRPGSYDELMITACPGGDGEYVLYEDDGVSQHYQVNDCARIKISQKRTKTGRSITVGKAKGTYAGFRKHRSLEIRLPGSVPPAAVKVGGTGLTYCHRLDAKGYTWDSRTASTIIRIPSFDITRGLRVTITDPRGVRERDADGLKGMLARADRARVLAAHVNCGREKDSRGRLPADAAMAGERISRDPASFKEERKRLSGLLKDLPAALRWRVRGKKEMDPERAACIARAVGLAKDVTKAFPV